jgi:hypothetical protein
MDLSQSAGLSMSTVSPTQLEQLSRAPSDILKSFRVSVKAYGALGNGKVDDTVAIQQAINAVNAKGGGTVFFPAGTYRLAIQPQRSQALILYGNIALVGEQYRNTILRLGDRQGNYNAILAGSSFAANLSNVTLRGLTIDSNGTHNPITSAQVLKQNQERYALRVYHGRHIRIEDCRFTDARNVNVITLNNDRLVSDIVIQNNLFDQIGGGSIDYDHSTIYIHGSRSLVAKNRFTSRNGAGTKGARTAIETHGSNHQVLDNQISGFTYGMNITGVASRSVNQTIRNNTLRNVHSGIMIWSYLDQGVTTKVGLDQVVIGNNTIEIDSRGWRKLWGDSPNQGIALEPNSDAEIDTLKIMNNTIRFHNLNDLGRPSDTLAGGIILWRNKKPDVEARNILISQNRIENVIASGLYISMPISGLNIRNNVIKNFGKGRYAFHPNYRVGMVIGVDKMSMKVEQNQLIDTQPKPTMTAGMVWAGNCPTACSQVNNRLVVSSGVSLPLLVQIP